MQLSSSFPASNAAPQKIAKIASHERGAAPEGAVVEGRGCKAGDSSGSYASCFWVPPPPPNVCRIYHNRKKTSYTEHVVEAPVTASTLPLIQLLESEANPSYRQVMKTIFAEGDANEESNLSDVLHKPDVNGWQPLLIATQRKQAGAVAALLELGATVDCRDPKSGWTPLMYAVANGDEPLARALLKHGASVNAFAKPSDWNALCVAILSSRSRLVEMLVDAGADVQLIKKRHPALAETYMAETPQASAKKCQVCKRACCRATANAGCAEQVVQGSPPKLIAAVQRSHEGEMVALLEQGADVECRDPASGWTPLMYAVANGNMAVMKQLLAHGASPNTLARPSWWNALCVAILSNRYEAVDLLLEHGADLEIVRRWEPDVLKACATELSAHEGEGGKQRASLLAIGGA